MNQSEVQQFKTGDHVEFKGYRLRVIGTTRKGEVLCEDSLGDQTTFIPSQLKLLEGVTSFDVYREVRMWVRQADKTIFDPREIMITGDHVNQSEMVGCREIVVRDGKLFMVAQDSR